MILAVDFDGTLTEDGFYPYSGEPIMKNIEYVKKVREDGGKVILWTCREKESLDYAIKWCKDQGIEFDAVNENLYKEKEQREYGYVSRKVYADVYLDDKAKKA